jgi:hypothetical protein
MFHFSGLDDIRLFPPVPFWKKIVFALICLFLLAYVVWCRWPRVPSGSASGYHQAQPAKAVVGLAKTTMPAARVQVYPKKEALKRLNVPSGDIDDDEQVIDSADIPAAPDGATTVTFFNISTGKSRTLYVEHERPLLSFEKGTELGMRYGLGSSGSQTAAVYARRDLARAGSFYLSGYGEASAQIVADPHPEAKIMIDISRRWR